MEIKLSEKALGISPSVTLEITAKAKAMKDSGVDVISFGAGEPDFNTPKHIQDEGIRAIKEGLTRYTPASGILDLKKAVCKKFEKDNGLIYGTENIIISSGAKHSIHNALTAILNPGDEVIIAVPYWVSYPELVSLAGGKPVYIKTKEEDDFKMKLSQLKDALTARTKAVIINSPSNPTGSIYNKAELEEIGNWAVENDLIIISDEIYEDLIYDGHKHVSIAEVSEAVKANTIVINGVSKAYAMTGWRIGYAAARKEIIKIMSNVQSHATSNPCSISQYASIVALEGSKDSVNLMKDHFVERRNYMVDTVNNIKGLSCRKPEGAFYVMINIKQVKGKELNGKKISSSLDFAKVLLEDSRVAVIPGIGFGDDDYVRLSYATSLDNIKEGLSRIQELMEKN